MTQTKKDNMDAMSPFKYEDEIPPEYQCGKCKAHGVRLYRDYEGCLSGQRLLCTACAEKDGNEPGTVDPEHPDAIGWMVAAVPTEDGSTFWGFTFVPDAGLKWWRALPVAVDAA